MQAVAGVFGLFVGSFLNVCIYRIPRGLSIVWPGSFCPGCHLAIPAYDNVPVLGWLWLRGQCRRCGRHIPVRYPIVEAMAGLLAAGLFAQNGLSSTTLLHFVFACSLIVVTFIDVDFQIIPDRISLGGTIVFLLTSSFVQTDVGWQSAVIGALFGSGLLFAVAFGYAKVAKREGLGGGDVKLLAMIGAFFGWKGVLPTLFVGALMGSLVGVALMILKKADRKTAIPFGPFLALGALTYLFFGDVFNEFLFPWRGGL
ncbi:MAG: prepilin peptidase [Nitrospirae bacterium]|nr:prepilin peptidase [Nitrospirota bacterium]